MAQEDMNTICEKREDFMVSPTGGIPTLRTAHFLKPTSESISGPDLKLPSLSPSSKWPIKVAFNGWRDPMKKWGSWVSLMRSRYESVWRKAGILEAIMASTFKIFRMPELIFGLGERWCPETNTFIFPFGEATITLEDMMVLGGFSVLGYPALMPLGTRESVAARGILDNARLQIVRSPSQKACHSAWQNHFMQSGSQAEHEAFLSLWLSRFVFPQHPHDTINKTVFPIAIHLARGLRIALAPAVLAGLYRDLGLLKEAIVASRELDPSCGKDSYLILTLWSPFLFVQVWVWERIHQLHPEPNSLGPGELRLARWHEMKRTRIDNIQSLIGSAGESFLWRPYTMAVDGWVWPKFYKENEMWVSNNSELDGELESFFYCLRACELFGLDCTEPYFPNRVAMQFGMDQDLPVWFPRSMAPREALWSNYIRPINDTKLYIPCRLFESDVTTRYLEWWTTLVSCPQGVPEPVIREKTSPRLSKRLEQTTGVTDDSKLSSDIRPTQNEDETGNELNNHEGRAEVNGGAKGMQRKDSPGTINLTLDRSSIQIKSEEMAAISGNGHESGFLDMAWVDVLKLEARVSRLERMVAAIKTMRSDHKRI